MRILDTTKYTYWLFFKNLITGKSDSTVHAIIHVILLLQGYKNTKRKSQTYTFYGHKF